MKRLMILLFALSLGVASATDALAGAEMVLLTVNQITYQGAPAYEYIYDIFADVQYYNYSIRDLDTTGLLNLHGGAFYDKWGAEAAGYPTWAGWTTYPSLGDQAATWTLNASHPDPSLNNWHAPAEYAGDYEPGYGACNAWGDGAVATVAADGYDGLKFNYAILVKAPAGLSQTIRLVHTEGPHGTIQFQADDGHQNNEVGPGELNDPCLEFDFNQNGEIDMDDLDILCANMGGDPGYYDVDGDGDVDEDDYIWIIENCLEYDCDGDGNPDGRGTWRGDFNLDGRVNGTDLSIMNGNFGNPGGFVDGNANCDVTVNGTDLSILAGTFGNTKCGAPIPEPMTLALLGLGSLALLRRRL